MFLMCSLVLEGTLKQQADLSKKVPYSCSGNFSLLTVNSRTVATKIYRSLVIKYVMMKMAFTFWSSCCEVYVIDSFLTHVMLTIYIIKTFVHIISTVSLYIILMKVKAHNRSVCCIDLIFLFYQTCVIVGSGGSDPPGVDRMFYALEMFCENLEGELLPHLPALMERLFAVLGAPTSVHMKELAISAIGATGKYFFKIIHASL